MDAKSLREAMKQKAKRLCGATSEKVDASTFTPAEPLNADVKTGARPVSRRAFKVGGKVDGAEAMTHAGRTPRKSGGKTEYANALVNRNVKDANEEREGIKHVGGFKKGGRTEKQVGGSNMISSLRPMPRPSREMMDEMGVAPMTRPKPRPSPERMEEIMNAAAEAEGMKALERANRAAERDQYDLETLGRKRGGKTEGSAKDMMEDKKMAAKMGMTMKEWEASHADKMHDMPSKGRTKKMGGGSMGMGMGMQDPMMSMPRGYKKGGKAEMMHHKDCMCKACVGAAMAQEGGRNAKMSGGSMGYAAGGKMKMVEKDGKKVPFFAADGVGKMANGGGLYANIHAKRERIEDGSKEKMRKPGAKGAPSASDFKDAAKTAMKKGGVAPLLPPVKERDFPISGRDMPTEMRQESDRYAGDLTRRKSGGSAMKKGGKAMHHKDCMCKACGGAAMSEEGGRTARKSGGKVGKSNISINIYPHTAEKAGAMPVPPAGMPPMMKPPMPMPAPMPSAPPPAHMSLPPGLQQALAGAAGAGPMPPAGGGMPQPMMNRPPMPAPMMGRKAGGRVEYPITGGSGGGRARKEKVTAYGEKMNKDLRK